jgi:Flp pilus assembly protein TadD
MLEEQAERPSEAEPADEVADNPAAGHNASGATLFDQEKVEEAIEEFRRAVMLDPDNGSYHCNLAVAYDEADQDDDARREYERALELNPNDTTALLYLGYLLNEKDEHERAAELWRRLAQLAPGTPDAEEAEQNLRAQEAL